jgi:UDP-3-O-[3-hydroxymyristoyl] N-acetylglucosamine deacetylase / 3-hydroxyacyl-[acyl-carrier-protein] dehydratase
MRNQKTIKNEISVKGTGIHTGKEVNVKLKPALSDSGVNFIRVDLESKPVIKAHISKITKPQRRLRRTSIGLNLKEKDIEVHTIEHIMAALCGLGIDNIVIELDSEELPALDGSAMGFVEVLKKAGIEEQDAERDYFDVRTPIWMQEDDCYIILLPSSNFEVSYTLNYNHPLLNSQYLDLIITPEIFEKEIAPSRTFCLEEEVDSLKKSGLGKGATYDNTIVLGEKGVKNNKLRFKDEFVRHKISDLIGDLYLLGKPIRGRLIAIKSGHSLNIKLTEKLYAHLEKVKEAGVRAAFIQQPEPPLDINAIKKILPHRYPFLFIDKIVELETDRKAVGIKNVTINDYFFKGHFPNRPIMPGVLIIEAMAQIAGVLMLSKPENAGKLAYFMSIDKVKFRKAVTPGDQLILEAEVVKIKSKTGQVHTKALVNDSVVSEADLMFTLVKA